MVGHLEEEDVIPFLPIQFGILSPMRVSGILALLCNLVLLSMRPKV